MAKGGELDEKLPQKGLLRPSVVPSLTDTQRTANAADWLRSFSGLYWQKPRECAPCPVPSLAGNCCRPASHHYLASRDARRGAEALAALKEGEVAQWKGKSDRKANANGL